jgi:tRNA-Thr(GGU) m(6)t(6)A37 methyltransferase TsaA
MDHKYFVKPIGVVHSTLKNLEDCPLQEYENAPEAVLEVYPGFIEGLDGLAAGSELIVFTWFHLANREVTKCYMRNDPDGPVVGVFTTRSPDRPNPIGIHRVRVVDMVSKNKLTVYPLEALDGTPLVDIKPVLNSKTF